jgi:hypothetical protein
VNKFWHNQFKQEMKHYVLRSKNSLILFGIRKNCLISGRGLLLYQFTRRLIKLTVAIIMGYHCYQLHTKFYPIFFSLRFSPYMDEITGAISVGCDTIDKLLIRPFTFIR